MTSGDDLTMIRCIPAALAIWARRQIEASISLPFAIMRSASSSIRMRIFSIFLSSMSFENCILECFWHLLLIRFCNGSSFPKQPTWCVLALFGSVITGVINAVGGCNLHHAWDRLGSF